MNKYHLSFLLVLAVSVASNALAEAPKADAATAPGAPAKTSESTSPAPDVEANTKEASSTEDKARKEAKPANEKKSKDKSKGNKSKKGAKAIPYPFDTCIVTDNELGSMGDTVTYVHEGQEVKFCCIPCEKKFLQDPERYLVKLKESPKSE